MRSGKWCLAALSLLAGMVGCIREQATLPQGNAIPAGAKIVKAEDRPEEPKRPPKAGTCVSAAVCFEQTGDNPKHGPAVRKKGYEQARKAYQQALEIEPMNQLALLGLARLADKEANYEQAVANYNEALKHYPNSAPIWFDFGMCWNRQKQWAPALECMNKALSLDPNNTHYCSGVGWTLARAGRYDESFEHFKRTSGEGRAYVNVAQMLLRMGEEARCRQCLQAALQIDPQMPEARNLLSRLDNPNQPEGPIQQVGQQTEPGREPAPRYIYTPEPESSSTPTASLLLPPVSRSTSP